MEGTEKENEIQKSVRQSSCYKSDVWLFPITFACYLMFGDDKISPDLSGGSSPNMGESWLVELVRGSGVCAECVLELGCGEPWVVR